MIEKVPISVEKIKKDFPILNRKINGKPLAYLDNAATSQKPLTVIEAVGAYYKNNNSNVHRGIHTLSEEATEMYESARKNVANFIGASSEEIVFTKGSTEALNMVAASWAVDNLSEKDIILTTEMEHHSNFVPWQIVAAKTGAELRVLPVDENGDIPLSFFEEELSENVKLVAVSQASNVLGTVLPIKKICDLAKTLGARVAVDGAQAAPHMHVNVSSLGCDFYAFSGHKMLGPMGIGVLWAKQELLEDMMPYQFGGGMIKQVSLGETTWADIPGKFEAGTPNVAGAVGLSAAIDYLKTIGMDEIRQHEISLNKYVLDKFSELKGVSVLGGDDPEKRSGLVSFTVDGLHSHDIAAVLNSEGVAVRSGHHCTQVLHKKLNIPSSTRASYYLYNDEEDIDQLVEGILKAQRILG